ncbi:MAG TPA: hypothetical protein VHB54_13950 [Mucilaginibacter sp.]|nr:hypothetical protein [Mucilaginibacter sp.]
MTNDPINQFLEALKNDVIHSLQANGKLATGQTAQNITIADDGGGAHLQLPAHIRFLESGRGPTGANVAAGGPPMIERIKQWCAAKGIPDQAAWAIKKSIDKKGYPGIPGILSEPLGEANISLRLNPVTDAIAETIARQLLDAIS